MASLRSLVVSIGADTKDIDTALARVGAGAKVAAAQVSQVGGQPLGQAAQKSFDELINKQRLTAEGALKMAAGLDRIGGASRLTASQVSVMNKALQDGVSAFAALGQKAPDDLQRVANSVRDLASATKSSGASGLSNNWIVDIATGGLLRDAIRGVVSEVVTLAKALPELALRGAAISDVEENFKRLTTQAGLLGNTLLGSLNQGTHNTVDNFTLMKLVNQDLAAGLVLTDKQFGALSQGAFALAQATGVTVKDALDTMNDAMLTGRTRSLALLTGKINLTAAESSFAKSLLSSADHLTEEGKLEAARVSILSAVGAATERLGVQTDGLDEKVAQMQVTWANFTDQLGKTIAQSPVIAAAFDGIQEALQNAFGRNEKDVITGIASAIDSAAIASVGFAQAAVTSGGFIVTEYYAIKKIIGDIVQVYDALALAGAYATRSILSGQTALGLGGDRITASTKQADDAIKQLTSSIAARADALHEDDRLQSAVAGTTDQLNATLDALRAKMQAAKDQASSFVGPLRDSAAALDANGAAAGRHSQFLKDDDEAMKKFVAQVKALTESLSGAGALGSAKAYEAALSNIKDVSTLTAKEQVGLIAAFSTVIEKYRLLGAAGAPVVAHFQALRAALFPLPPQIALVSADLSELGTRVDLAPLALDAATLGKSVNQLGREGQFSAIQIEAMAKSLLLLPAGAEGAGAAIRGLGTETQKTFGESFTGAIKSSLDRIPSIFKDAFTGGGGILGALKAILVDFGSSMASVIANALGKSLSSKLASAVAPAVSSLGGTAAAGLASTGAGALTGGAGAGAAAAGGIGISLATAGITLGISAAIIGGIALYKHLHQSETEKLGKDIGRDLGVNISKEMLTAMEADSKNFGRQAAELLNLDKIIESAGGLNTGNFDKFAGKLHDVFSLIQTGQLTAAQGAAIVDKNWAAMLAQGTDTYGFLGDKLKEIIRLNEVFGTQSKEIAGYLLGQGQAAITASNNILKGASAAASSAQQLQDLGTIALSTFAAAVASGSSFAQALTLASPGLKELKAGFDRLGISVDNAALKTLLLQSAILENNPALLTAIGGLGDAFVALDNLGLLTSDTFSAMQRTGLDAYSQLQGAVAGVGGSTRDALLPMQDFLHKATKAASDLGIPLDDATQILIDQSKELGIWKEAGLTAAEKQEAAFGRLIDKMNDFIDALNGIPARRVVDIDVNTHNNIDNGSETGGSGGSTGPDVQRASPNVLAFPSRPTGQAVLARTQQQAISASIGSLSRVASTEGIEKRLDQLVKSQAVDRAEAPHRIAKYVKAAVETARGRG